MELLLAFIAGFAVCACIGLVGVLWFGRFETWQR